MHPWCYSTPYLHFWCCTVTALAPLLPQTSVKELCSKSLVEFYRRSNATKEKERDNTAARAQHRTQPEDDLTCSLLALFAENILANLSRINCEVMLIVLWHLFTNVSY